MDYTNNPLFYNSILLFSDASIEKIMNTRIAIAGIGGVGSIITELLARNGVGFLRISDIDPYEYKNLNRQLFATHETIGINKAIAGADRIKSINPDCHVEVYENGINLSNVREFCKDIDILIIQTDTESSKVILHRVAKEYGIKVVCGSRGSIFGHRWNIKAKVWDYKKYPDMSCYDATNHPELAGISLKDMTDKMLNNYDEIIKNKKISLFRDYAKSKPEMFGSISQEDLIDRINNYEKFFNRHVCSVLANTGGCLAVTAALRLILDGPDDELEMNLWTGSTNDSSNEPEKVLFTA